MASMLAVMALVHLAALAVLLLAARNSVRLVDAAGRPVAHREPEPRAGEAPDPSAYRPGPPKRPEARFLA